MITFSVCDSHGFYPLISYHSVIGPLAIKLVVELFLPVYLLAFSNFIGVPVPISYFLEVTALLWNNSG